jgi:putative membrane protein
MSKSNFKPFFNNLFNYLSLLILGAFVISLFFGNKLVLLIHPRYSWFTLISAMIILVVGLIGIYSTIMSLRKNKITFKSSYLISSNLLIFLICLVVPFVPITTLSSESFMIRETGSYINFTGNETKEFKVKFESNIDTKTFEFTDWITAKYIGDLNIFDKKQFRGEGFITATDIDQQFKLSRFIVSCCAIDATPVSLDVNYDYKKEFKVDDWVRIEGEFAIQNINGQDQPVIIPQKIDKIDEPANAYLTRK